jgi:flavin reductase (DIM6/NTAB) family NADH-FMN oxidoreductase RutF
MSQRSGFAGTSPEIAGAIGVGFGLVAGTILGRFLSTTRITITTTRPALLTNRPPYKPGQTPTLPSPTFGKHVVVFDPSELKSSYNLMISTVTPRPIALVSSRSPTGVDNVSPFSYFNAVAHDPPILAIGFCRKGGLQKDSLVNILETKQFAVNIISDWYLDAANHACGNFAPEIDEFLESGMTKVECISVAASRVAQAAVTYECLLEHVYPVTDNEGRPTTEIVLAKVVRVHVDQQVLVDDFDPTKPVVDTNKLKPVGRLGGNTYCNPLCETVDIARPQVT